MLDKLKNKKFYRPLQGVILSMGSPFGWMLIQVISGKNPVDDFISNEGIYIYLSLGTALIFCLFGYYVGIYEEKIENLSLVDPLTGLYNNRYFHDRLHQELILAIRNNQYLAVILFDLDHFKLVNDTHGHLAGDQVLRDVSRSMTQCSRQGETIARVGGEEICVILPNCTLERAKNVAERFCYAIRNMGGRFPDGSNATITASAGVASINAANHSGSEWDLYAKADESMYLAKERGRDQIVAQ